MRLLKTDKRLLYVWLNVLVFLTRKHKRSLRLLLLAGLVPLGAMAFKSVRAAAKQRNTVNDKSNSNKPKANYNKPKKPKANYNSNSGSDLPDNVKAVERMLRKKI